MRSVFLLSALMLGVQVFTFSPAMAQSVIVENFTAANCPDSHESQPFIASLSDTHPDALIIGCHLTIAQEETEFSTEDCKQRSIPYISRRPFHGGIPFTYINGLYSTDDDYHNVISSGISLARADHSLSPLPLKIEGKNIISALPEAQLEEPLDLWFAAYNYEGITNYVDPTFIEQKPRSFFGRYSDPVMPDTVEIKFRNIVSKFVKLGDWNGHAETITIPLGDDNADAYILIAQKKDQKEILWSGTVKRKPEPQHNNIGKMSLPLEQH